jgi:hypothetical protein
MGEVSLWYRNHECYEEQSRATSLEICISLRIPWELKHSKEKEGVFNSSIDPMGEYNRFGPSTRKSHARFLDLLP